MRLFYSIFAFFLSFSIFGQKQFDDFHLRSGLVPSMAPFYHGVASGDPLSDRVIIWTRFTPDEVIQPNESVTLNWRMATDVDMQNIVASGQVSTSMERDFTAKVDVSGLQPFTCYYYDFSYNSLYSIVGRTKTAPASSVDNLRFAVVSCSDYQRGYFNVYASIAEHNDIDAVIHLGDYIYEYEASAGPDGRTSEPSNETISLADYRTRYSHYRLDKDLRNVHQAHPFIAVWDDHETANNSWMDGADNHTTSSEGEWSIRKASGKQAFMEWMPIRENAVENGQIYRAIRYGNLMNLYMLDTRLEGRMEQVGATSSALNDADRTLISEQQYSWLVGELQQSQAQWNVLGQQIMMAPLKAFGVPVNLDQWDGYPAQRTRLYNDVLSNNIQNMVVLTGDIHTSWANDLPGSGYNASTGAGSVGVEFVVTSVTSASSPLGVPTSIISSSNPHNKWSELSKKGYLILDLNATRTQAEWWFVNSITSPSSEVSLGAKYMVNSGERFLRNAGDISSRTEGLCQSVNFVDPNASLSTLSNNLVWVSAYPNPFDKEITLQFNASKASKMKINILDNQGKRMKTIETEIVPGMNYFNLEAENLKSGTYSIELNAGRNNKVVRVIRL
ncbi:MAG: hypothetical protein RL264_2953 [Bacteroidota bacterium]|jgi:alkaline phosphatase D